MDTRVSELELLLHEGVHEGVFPGAVAALGWREGSTVQRLSACAGVLTKEGAFAELDTIYDLASLTKPFVAVSALRLSQAGRVDLHGPVADVLPELAETVGGEASVASLLSHRAGLSPWGGLFRETRAPFGSAEAKRFILREAATRGYTGEPAQGSVYSDLGYIVAGEALARAAGVPLDRLVREQVTDPLGISQEVFYAAALPADRRDELLERVAPTEQCEFRGRVVLGEVHDENCAVFGGIAGHAGLFGQADAVLDFGLALLDALEGRSRWLDQGILRWALKPRPGGGHVIGWDTKSAEGSSAGGLFSSRAFGHLGFTGTSIWCDPARALCVVLLSNRVHTTRENIKIRTYRPHFHDAVVRLIFGDD
ncbi:MAG: serine hydrolase domain-containing protein [Myxococcales bacterium]